MESQQGFLESLEVVPHCFENVPLKPWVHRLSALITIWPLGGREIQCFIFLEHDSDFLVGITFYHKVDVKKMAQTINNKISQNRHVMCSRLPTMMIGWFCA